MGCWGGVFSAILSNMETALMSVFPVVAASSAWIDGWLIVGKPEKDGIGTMVWNPERPVMKNPEPLTETARGFLPDDLGTLPRRQDGSVHVQRWR